MKTCNQKKNSDKNDGQMKKLDERKNCVKSFFFHEKTKISFMRVHTQGRLCISATPHQ